MQRYICYNKYFKNLILKVLQNDSQKILRFYEWLKNDGNLKRKIDFIKNWTIFVNDTDE